MPGTYAPPAVELPNTSAIVGMPAAESCGEIAEELARRDEELGLGGQVGAARLDEVDRAAAGCRVRSPARAAFFFQRVRVHRPAAHRGVVRR